MIRALVWKELRETAGIAAGFLVVALIYISPLMDWHLLPYALLMSWNVFSTTFASATRADYFPFKDFAMTYGFISAGFAIALGFRQSVSEPARGTALYLFHRPIDRRTIVLIKLMTGLVLQSLLMCIPILIYASRAATPGNIAAPFEWSMTIPSFQVVATMAIVYLASFSSGIYVASWVGARLLPLLAGAVLVLFLVDTGRWWIIGVPGLTIICSWFVSNILVEVRTRDY